MVILFVDLMVDFEIRHLRCANHQLAQDSDAHGDRSNKLIPFGSSVQTMPRLALATTNQYEKKNENYKKYTVVFHQFCTTVHHT
jgi:hypothetical protein